MAGNLQNQTCLTPRLIKDDDKEAAEADTDQRSQTTRREQRRGSLRPLFDPTLHHLPALPFWAHTHTWLICRGQPAHLVLFFFPFLRTSTTCSYWRVSRPQAHLPCPSAPTPYTLRACSFPFSPTPHPLPCHSCVRQNFHLVAGCTGHLNSEALALLPS